MTNTDIFYTKLLPLLSAKNGPKILLFDPDTPLFFSNIIAHSTFLDLDFFLFDNITNKSRQKISQMVCYCLIRPSNLHLLINELKNPFYDSYIILFTNKLTEKQLIELADNDNKSIISEVYEIFTDCIFEDEMLYLVDKDAELGCNKIKRIVEGVSSICHTLETQPFIFYQNDSEVLKVLASEIIKNTEKLEKSSQLIIFDRKIDLYTPLIYNWTFQSMIYDKCKYENGIVSFTDKTYSIIQNEVFESLKFRDINSVGTELQNFTKRINEQKISTSIVDNIEEKVKRNETAESLLSIYNFLLSDCLKNKELSDIEHKIISENSIKVSELKKILKNNIFLLNID
ncbi:vacuolar protein sorting-associated protein 45 [Gurleya vavrai]